MAQTEILLLQPVEKLGGEGDIVKVKAGYARNYLLPRKVGMRVSGATRKQIEALQKARAIRESKEKEHAEALAKRIESLHLAIPVKTGEGGRMFGAVTSVHLQERMAEEGIEIDRKHIGLHSPIKTIGRHSTHIRLHPEISVEFSFDIVSENPIVESGETQ